MYFVEFRDRYYAPEDAIETEYTYTLHETLTDAVVKADSIYRHNIQGAEDGLNRVVCVYEVVDCFQCSDGRTTLNYCFAILRKSKVSKRFVDIGFGETERYCIAECDGKFSVCLID